MKVAIYPGSFDPMTLGHFDVLKTAASIFDKVIIAVLNNTRKTYFLTIDERTKLIKGTVKDISNVEVDSFEGLTVDYAKKMSAKVIIRGLRAVSDFEYEMQLSQNNRALSSDINTVFLITKPEYNFISSSFVKEIYMMGGDIKKFVPKYVYEYLGKNKIINQRGN